MPVTSPKTLRLLVVLPSWVGDVVMATPALRLIRASLPGAFIGALVRPGLDELLAGTGFIDELHIERAYGVMGPKLVAARLRPRRYDTALLFTNSFSTALITRLAFIPRRIGYDRDARGLLLTEKLQPPRRLRLHRGFAPISAVDYYLDAAKSVLSSQPPVEGDGGALPNAIHAAPHPSHRLELATTPQQDQAAAAILSRAAITTPFAILNPGGNNPAKRWPAERFAAVARHLINAHRLAIVINGSPEEAELAHQLGALIGPGALPVACLPDLGITIGALKGVAKRSAFMLTNDTGPRHIAAAFGIPTVALFGPTDPRWTTLPDSAMYSPSAPVASTLRELYLTADPTLPPEEVADDHPERCRIDRITTEGVISAADALLHSPARTHHSLFDRI